MLGRNILLLVFSISLILTLAACSSTSLKVTPTEGLDGFEAGIDEIRVGLNIPGLSAC